MISLTIKNMSGYNVQLASQSYKNLGKHFKSKPFIMEKFGKVQRSIRKKMNIMLRQNKHDILRIKNMTRYHIFDGFHIMQLCFFNQ